LYLIEPCIGYVVPVIITIVDSSEAPLAKEYRWNRDYRWCL